ncbi:protein FANTASTIC FOUR 3-like [Nicotiana sylvestris]|uniref:Protein AF-9-like n=1 Tax=Nicotiana sylvestris TaxID=4096 RepID=A0A1U7V650_NICSY|nr:PREDICTED: protein AF-9-like [Nicotiana sylvestris]
MAACGSLQHIFEKPLPENPTLIESLSSTSWKNSKSLKPNIDNSSFTEIFGELHFKENNNSISSSASSSSSSSVVSSSSSFSSCLPQSSASSSLSSLSSSSSSSFFLDAIHQSEIKGLDNIKDKYERNKSPISSYYPNTNSCSHKKQDRHSDSFSSRTSDSLSVCTEGLGFESSDDVEDLMNDLSIENQKKQQEEKGRMRVPCRPENQVIINHDYSKRSRTNKGSFPPPISCIGRSGKPWVCFKSFREDGRFILKEIRIPTQEFLHACREDGRLMMHVIHSDDEIVDEDEDEYEDDDDDVDDDTHNVEEEHDAKHV